MTVQSAYTEVAALQCLENSEFDVILIDRHLLSVDGLDLASNIQEIFPTLPIIIMTSVVDTITSDSTDLAGYLTKPITSSKLYQLFLNLFSTVDAQPTHLLESFQLSSNFATEYPFKILIVEDNSVNQQILLLMLEHLGYTGDTVNNGLEAVNALKSQVYDLVFMDIQMPIMDGLTACQQIRQLPERSPWIIGLSANAFRESREMALSVGMNNYLTKPLQIEDLVRTLQRISEYLKSSQQPLGLAKSDLLSRSLESLTENPVELAKVQFNSINPSISASHICSELELSMSKLDVINSEKIKGLENFISKRELTEVIYSYLAESELAIAKIKYSLKQLDFAAISFENHSLRGGCGTLGADRLVAICQQLSNVCKGNDQDHKVKEVEEVIQQLDLEFAKVSQVLKQKISA
jgi:CheY-like chemotaxis protein/HPt (histidine-containing phosphotransfer) domain-containing protein